MNETSSQIFVVDDDPGVRDALGFLLDTVDLDAQLFESAQAFLDRYDGGGGVLVLDVRMPGMSGLELQDVLKERGHDQLSIIFISGHGDIPMAVEAVKRGALDFIPKPFRDQELLDRIQDALEHSRSSSRQRTQISEVRSRIESLTPREKEVMDRVARGDANKVVAFDLDISQRTVEIHRAHVMEKMQARSLAQMVRDLHAAGYFEA